MTTRNIFLLFLIVIKLGGTVSSQSLNELITDIENLEKLGKRPLSFGKKHYLDAQGGIQNTYNEFDFAINGCGFFALRDDKTGNIYTSRNGSYVLNEDGFLVNRDGFLVLHSSSSITDAIYAYIDMSVLFPKEKRTLTERQSIFPSLHSVSKVTYPFLILRPQDFSACEILDSEYSVFYDYQICSESDFSIIRGALEYMPLDINKMLEKTLEYFKYSQIDGYEKKIIYGLLESHYNTIKSYSDTNNEYSVRTGELFFILEKCLQSNPLFSGKPIG
jgi:hypothetical protein